jgi:hypothetical protein
MKSTLLSAICVLCVACSGSDTKRATTAPVPPADGDTPVANAIPAADTTVADASSCDKEIALTCPDGQVDGCTVTNDAGKSLTNLHVCVPTSETFSQPPCTQEIARECGDGLIDACLRKPAASTLHVCIASPPSPDDSVKSDAPSDSTTND